MNRIKQTKSALNQMALYLCEAYVQTGSTRESAKIKVAKDLVELSRAYSDSKVPAVDTSGILTLLDTAIKQAKDLGVEGMALKNMLVDIKRLLEAGK